MKNIENILQRNIVDRILRTVKSRGFRVTFVEARDYEVEDTIEVLRAAEKPIKASDIMVAAAEAGTYLTFGLLHRNDEIEGEMHVLLDDYENPIVDWSNLKGEGDAIEADFFLGHRPMVQELAEVVRKHSKAVTA